MRVLRAGDEQCYCLPRRRQAVGAAAAVFWLRAKILAAIAAEFRCRPSNRIAAARADPNNPSCSRTKGRLFLTIIKLAVCLHVLFPLMTRPVARLLNPEGWDESEMRGS